MQFRRFENIELLDFVGKNQWFSHSEFLGVTKSGRQIVVDYPTIVVADGSERLNTFNIDVLANKCNRILDDKHKFIVWLPKSDKYTDYNILKKFKPNIYIAGNNVSVSHERLLWVPMGLRYFYKSLGDLEFYKKYFNLSHVIIDDTIPAKKDILCWSFFSLDTHKDRPKIHDTLKNKDWIYIMKNEKWANQSITPQEFTNIGKRCKFIITPRGNAVETFRFYESYHLGAIPITTKEFYHQFLPTDYPVFFTKDYDDFTENRLKKFYEENHHKIPKLTGKEWITFLVNKLKELNEIKT